MLKPGTQHCENNAYSTLGPITKSVKVKFAKKNTTEQGYETNHEPHKPTSENVMARVKIYDEDGVYFPGCKVAFHFIIPNDQDKTTEVISPIAPGLTSCASPNPESAGWGTCQATSDIVITPTFDLKFTLPENWKIEYLEGEGITISSNWEGHGGLFNALIHPVLKFVTNLIKHL